MQVVGFVGTVSGSDLLKVAIKQVATARCSDNMKKKIAIVQKTLEADKFSVID